MSDGITDMMKDIESCIFDARGEYPIDFPEVSDDDLKKEKQKFIDHLLTSNVIHNFDSYWNFNITPYYYFKNKI